MQTLEDRLLAEYKTKLEEIFKLLGLISKVQINFPLSGRLTSPSVKKLMEESRKVTYTSLEPYFFQDLDEEILSDI